MTEAAWHIGSYASWPSQTVTFGGALAGAHEVAATESGIYLHHDTDALSCFDQVIAALTAGGATNPYCRFNKNRKVQLGHTGANFTLTWTDTLLRDFLGFTGNLTGAAAYEAQQVSRYFWSPGRPESSMKAPAGVVGNEVPDITVTAAPGGVLCVTDTGQSDTVNDHQFSHIAAARYWTTTAGEPGEYRAFHTAVLRKGWKFLMVRNVDEDDSSSSAASYTIGSAIGPYVLDPSQEGFVSIPFAREFAQVDRSNKLVMHVLKTQEYS